MPSENGEVSARDLRSWSKRKAPALNRRKPTHLFDESGTYARAPEPDPDFLVSTTPTLENRPIGEYLGLVVGEAIVAPDMFRDFAASVTSIFGGRSNAYETPLIEARSVALAEAIEAAKDRGAEAIVGVDLDYEAIGGMLLVTLSGTAVRFEA